MDLEKEFKKLNFALDSYPCDYHADYEEDNNTGQVRLLLLDSGELPIIEENVYYGDNFEDEVNTFKSKAIKKCSHS
jgi:hypothetical protein